MKHLDLFSGIGGFALATEMVWDNVEHIFCDNEPFAQAILKKHWPNSTIYGDIRTLTADSYFERHLHGGPEKLPTEGPHEAQCEPVASARPPALPVDLLTGGFPCQPFSQAGARRGTEDDRHLWPEMLRVIREFHPRWVVGENVGGLVTWSEGLVLEQIHADLESEGYEVQAFIIPAVAVNAPHRRDRVWIVAHKSGTRLERSAGQGVQGRGDGFTSKDSNAPDTPSKQAHTTKPSRLHAESTSTSWNTNWLEVATRLCRVDDGLPRRLDRNPRLKGLGNAIVPQVAAEIFKAIKEIDK